jgi:hypothetical protein
LAGAQCGSTAFTPLEADVLAEIKHAITCFAEVTNIAAPNAAARIDEQPKEASGFF